MSIQGLIPFDFGVPAGTYEVVSVSVYASVLALGGPVTMEFALYTDWMGGANIQIANSYAAQVFPINSAASWKTMVYPMPRPLIVVTGPGTTEVHICVNATGGRVGSNVTCFWDNGVTPRTVIDGPKNDPAAAGLFSNPWGLPGGALCAASAYLILDVPNRNELRPNEKYYRLQGHRGGQR
jgi:hypothetical protein